MVDNISTNIHVPTKNEAISESNKYSILSSTAIKKIPQQDTVEISSNQNEEKSTGLNKWIKGVIALGTVALTGLGIYLCHGKIKAKQLEKEAQKAAEETQKLVEQNRINSQEEAKKAAGEARIKTKQETKEPVKQPVSQAKTEDPNTASKTLEVQEKLKTNANEIVHNDIFEKLISDFEKKVELNMWSSECDSLEAYSEEIIKALKTAEEKVPNLTELEELYKSLIKSNPKTPEQIKTIIEKINNPSQIFEQQHILIDRTNFITDIEKLKETNPIKQGEKFSNYMQRLFKLRKEEVSTIEQTHLEAIESKLVYAPDKPIKIELTDKELETLKKWKPNEYKDLTKEQALKELSGYRSTWTQGYTSEGTDGGLPDEIEQILLEKTFPRFNSTTAKQYEYHKDKGTIRPVARWMNISGTQFCKDGNVDKYIEETFKVGETYTAPMRQSCSMSLKSAGDACFSDNYPFEIKMIIHPRSATSKAADISQFADASCKYGFLEVVYPKGSKFNVLDKQLEICKDKDGQTYHRWLIKLQES